MNVKLAKGIAVLFLRKGYLLLADEKLFLRTSTGKNNGFPFLDIFVRSCLSKPRTCLNIENNWTSCLLYTFDALLVAQ